MNDLITQIREIDRKIDAIVPILVSDDCQQAGEWIQDMFRELTVVFQSMIQIPEITKEIDISSYMKSLEGFVFAVHVMDTIQIADILLYEVRGMFHSVYKLCEGGA